MDLGTLLRLAAERTPENVAVADGELRLTYAAWDALVNSAAAALG